MTDFANEYGDALFSLTREEGIDKRVMEEAETLAECFRQTPAFIRLLDNRFLSAEERIDILRRSFSAQVHPYLLNFLMILCRRGAMPEFADCVKRFRRDYNDANNISQAVVTSAKALTQEQRARLTQALEKRTGKTIMLKETVDDRVIGGLRVDVDGVRIDNTLKNRLETLRAALHAEN